MHSLQVERVAKALAQRHGLDVCAAGAAGLVHDCAKGLSLSQLRQTARAGGLQVDEEMWASKALMHAPVGAYLARRDYGVTGETALAAVRWHTTGRPGMSALEQVVFLADMIEPGRKAFPGLADITRAAETDLAQAMCLALRGTVAYIRARGQALYAVTQATLDWFEGKYDYHPNEEAR
jgi:predicted HD superfamily hydrolase involved in NAD metabolism